MTISLRDKLRWIKAVAEQEPTEQGFIGPFIKIEVSSADRVTGFHAKLEPHEIDKLLSLLDGR
jgi:hypothetical protein